MSKKEFSTQQVLELACAAQRVNGAYIKEAEGVYSSDGIYMYTKQTNKMQMLCTVNPTNWTADPKDAPMPLKIADEDVVLAQEIKTYYKRLLFAAIEGENDFQTNINSFLSSENIETKNFGYIACLPHVYVKDKMQNKLKKVARSVDEGHLGEVGSNLKDLDAEILSSVKSKNFEGYNIDAIIHNKMASWINKTSLNLGACVIVKAKVKDHTKHWKHQNDVTRLNYVKAAQ
jgi:hypothetical protein